MRNVFDQYTQAENRLTHSLMMALYWDKSFLKSFLRKFGPEHIPSLRKIEVIQQAVPGSVVDGSEDEAERRGLPDGIIYDEESGWAFLIESKIGAELTADQLNRHVRTIARCGYEDICGIAITVNEAALRVKNWQLLRWQEIYSWASRFRAESFWVSQMLDYFEVIEMKIAQAGIEGTITKFSGIHLDPYTYPAAKRTLRLLTDKIRSKKQFIKRMRLDAESRRPAITDDDGRVWDYISFQAPEAVKKFTDFPHCTIGLSGREHKAEGMITFPNAIDRGLLRRLSDDSYEDFSARLESALGSIQKELKGVKGYKPVIRLVQRHYKTQRSKAVIDGLMDVDLRACFGGKDGLTGKSIKRQEEWLHAFYALLANKRSNLQFQIGVVFPFDGCPDIKTEHADEVFMASFLSLHGFVRDVAG